MAKSMSLDEDTTLDNQLARLGETLSVTERLDILSHVVCYWHGPMTEAERFLPEASEGRQLPLPLRWLCGWGDRRKQVFPSFPHRLLEFGELFADADGKMVFCRESENVFSWATEPQGDDPPVWGRFNDSRRQAWIKEEISLSGFLIPACLVDGLFGAEYQAAASWTAGQTLEWVVTPLRPLPLAAWRFPADPSRVWARAGAFVFACPNGEVDGVLGYSVWVGARHRESLAYLRDIVADGWEHVAL
jgi:hypothetical protein